MRVRQCRRLPEIAEVTQDGAAFEALRQPRLTGSAQFLVPPP